MSTYTQIKQAVSVPEAAKHYGHAVTRNGMACCPFHPDHTPSLKLNENYFFCFGCQKSGDVIDFTANLFQISQPQAAQKLMDDFSLHPNPNTESKETSSLTEYPLVREFRKESCAPRIPGDPWDDRYVESCQMLPTVRYILDLLSVVDFQERHAIVQRLRENDYLLKLQSYVTEKRKEAHGRKRYSEQLCS